MNILDKGCVLFTFDDGHESVWRNARDVFAAEGVPATAFVSKLVIGQPGRMTVGQLQALQHSYAWDICSHTRTHVKLPYVSDDSELDKEFAENVEWMQENGLGPLDVVAYPWGLTNERVSAMAAKYHTHGRICMHGSRNVETLPFVSPFAITARPFSFEYNHGESMPFLKETPAGSATVLYSHWCQDDGSRLSCSPAALRDCIRSVKDAGLNIVNFSGLLAAVGGR